MLEFYEQLRCFKADDVPVFGLEQSIIKRRIIKYEMHFPTITTDVIEQYFNLTRLQQDLPFLTKFEIYAYLQQLHDYHLGFDLDARYAWPGLDLNHVQMWMSESDKCAEPFKVEDKHLKPLIHDNLRGFEPNHAVEIGLVNAIIWERIREYESEWERSCQRRRIYRDYSSTNFGCNLLKVDLPFLTVSEISSGIKLLKAIYDPKSGDGVCSESAEAWSRFQEQPKILV